MQYQIRYTYPNVLGNYYTSTSTFAFDWKEEQMEEVLKSVKESLGKDVVIQVIRNHDDSIVCTL
jgi:3-deoxy-D-arabino-heptulosonate 7-phosphate (DAHP) synthase